MIQPIESIFDDRIECTEPVRQNNLAPIREFSQAEYFSPCLFILALVFTPKHQTMAPTPKENLSPTAQNTRHQ
jgi:hypothetical protein